MTARLVAIHPSYWERSVLPRISRTAPLKPGPGLGGPPFHVTLSEGAPVKIYLERMGQPPKLTRKAEGTVPLHPALAYHLKEWQVQTPYAKETDFVFPSLTTEGRVPLSPAVFVADLRPAALKAGVRIPDGHRFG